MNKTKILFNYNALKVIRLLSHYKNAKKIEAIAVAPYCAKEVPPDLNLKQIFTNGVLNS